MAKESKATNAEMHWRIDKCYNKLLEGWTPESIFRNVSQMSELRETKSPEYEPSWDWGVGRRQIENYCQKALELMKEFSAPKRKARLNLALARYTEMYRISMEKDDLTNARLILKEIGKLQGLYDQFAPENQNTGSIIKLAEGVEIVI